MLVEFIIDTDNDRWRWRMIRHLVFPYAVSAVCIVLSFFLNPITFLSWAAAIFLISTIWAYYKTRRVLYRLSFDNETKQVTVDIVLIDQLNKRFIIPFEDFRVEVSDYDNLYRLKIYENKKLLYKQYSKCGWTGQDFKSIQDYARLMIPFKKNITTS